MKKILMTVAFAALTIEELTHKQSLEFAPDLTLLM